MEFSYKSKVFDVVGICENDHIYRKIVDSGSFYELKLLEYIHKIIHSSSKGRNPPPSVAIDIGANIGNHSLFFSSFVCDQVIAVEPNPAVIPILQSNLKQNIHNCHIYEFGLGDEESTGSIDLAYAKDNLGAAKISQESDGSIKITTLDSLLSQHLEPSSVVSLIKIDVEGMEPQVLRGAKNTLSKYKPEIFVEASSKQELEKTQSVLEPLGYTRLHGRWATTPVYHFSYKPTLKLRLYNFALFLRAKIIKVFCLG